jgi:hypothetical protein
VVMLVFMVVVVCKCTTDHEGRCEQNRRKFHFILP